MDKTSLKLLGLQRAEYEKAKKDERLSGIFQVIVSVVGVASVFTKGEIWIYSLALCSLFSTILKWRFTLISKIHKSVSDRARRLIMLIEGLGYKVSSKEVTDVIADFSVSEKERNKYEDPEYFETKLPVGPRKFCLILQESSFFSKHLYKISAEQTWAFVIAAFILSLITLFVLPSMSNQSWILAIARVVIVVLMFLTSTELLTKAILYSEAATIASKTDDRLEHVKESHNPEYDIIYIFSDYNAGVESAPLISTSVYAKNRNRLNTLWSKRSTNWEE
jgi:hypothetical protein